MQDKIDACIAKIGPSASARAFVRPSGTEPIVRIYAEASTAEQVEDLTKDIRDVLIEMLP